MGCNLTLATMRKECLEGGSEQARCKWTQVSTQPPATWQQCSLPTHILTGAHAGRTLLCKAVPVL